ncbi:hypothetical protein ACOZ4N_05610 [Halorientalis pallida]|uniref:hypothetical protein n=1 Tax=Halorientalis pallida TaxID=2479928 RepID=UPI003C6F70D2
MAESYTYQGESSEWELWADGPSLHESFFEEPAPSESYRDAERHGTVQFAPMVYPESGRYVPAHHRLTLTPFGRQKPDDPHVEPVSLRERTRVIDLLAEVTRSHAFGSRFDLRVETLDGVAVGQIVDLPPGPVPEAYSDLGDWFYLRLRVDYLHEETKDRTGYTEDEIDGRRGRSRERIAEIRDRTG